MDKIKKFFKFCIEKCEEYIGGMAIFLMLLMVTLMYVCMFAPIVAIILPFVLVMAPKSEKFGKARNLILQLWGAAIFFSAVSMWSLGFFLIPAIIIGAIGVLIFLISRYHLWIKEIFQKLRKYKLSII